MGRGRRKKRKSISPKGFEGKEGMMWIPEEIKSYGEKRMLYLWALFAHAEPHNAILFDEPTAALDDRGASWFVDMVKKSRNQIIIATSDKRLLKIPNANIYETYLENGAAKVKLYRKRGK